MVTSPKASLKQHRNAALYIMIYQEEKEKHCPVVHPISVCRILPNKGSRWRQITCYWWGGVYSLTEQPPRKSHLQGNHIPKEIMLYWWEGAYSLIEQPPKKSHLQGNHAVLMRRRIFTYRAASKEMMRRRIFTHRAASKEITFPRKSGCIDEKAHIHSQSSIQGNHISKEIMLHWWEGAYSLTA